MYHGQEMATPEPGAALARDDAGIARPKSVTGVFLGRLLIVHLVAYAIAFSSAVAQMPIAIWFRKQELLEARPTGATVGLVRHAAQGLALSATEAAQLQTVLVFILWGGLAILLVVHIVGLPWAIGAARAARHPELTAAATRGYRIFGYACATIGAMVALAGVAGWVWLFTL